MGGATGSTTPEQLIEAIRPLDPQARQQARLRQDALTKPRGSLGRPREGTGNAGTP
jgi:NaMN:DMB phosphoribosyltransferase